jgi:hypothetical protein
MSSINTRELSYRKRETSIAVLSLTSLVNAIYFLRTPDGTNKTYPHTILER